MPAEWLKIGSSGGEAWGGALDRAVDVLRRGGLISFATDTYYAIGADPLNAEAVADVFRIKGRDLTRPLPLLVSGLSQVRRITGRPLPSALQPLLERHWPGPLTVVLPGGRPLPPGLSSAGGAVGLRWPRGSLPNELIRRFGLALTGTSANRSGAPAPVTGAAVFEGLGDELELILDSGPAPGGGSTVVAYRVGDSDSPRLSLIREGRISLSLLEAELGGTPSCAERETAADE